MRRAGLILILLAACSQDQSPRADDSPNDAGADHAPIGADAAEVGPSVDNLDAVLEPIRDKYSLPSLAAAVWIGGELVAEGAVGVRKLGDPTPVTTHDAWHLGSCTKAMTATLLGMLVDEETLSFSTALADAFSGEEVSAGYQPVTLEQLLHHRGGVPANPPSPLWSQMWKDLRSFETRRDVVLAMLKEAPPNPVGEYLYSNAGYMMVGAAMERATSEAWEDAMRARLFTPLGMTSCGFGPPATKGNVDAPWGHTDKDGTLTPVEPGVQADNPPSLGPAGTVHSARSPTGGSSWPCT